MSCRFFFNDSATTEIYTRSLVGSSDVYKRQMQDQVDALRQLGVRASFLNSTLSVPAQRAVENALRGGELDLLYVAPERLFQVQTLSLIHIPEPTRPY